MIPNRGFDVGQHSRRGRREPEAQTDENQETKGLVFDLERVGDRSLEGAADDHQGAGHDEGLEDAVLLAVDNPAEPATKGGTPEHGQQHETGLEGALAVDDLEPDRERVDGDEVGEAEEHGVQHAGEVGAVADEAQGERGGHLALPHALDEDLPAEKGEHAQDSQDQGGDEDGSAPLVGVDAGVLEREDGQDRRGNE